MFFATLGVIASSMERLATEIRHLQRTEVREAEEFFSEGQKGSSSMPHKRNPVLTENITGLARIVRSAVIPAMENVATWHERDISHSSVERMIAPDATVTLDFALARLAGVIEKLVVYPDAMRGNLDNLRGLVFSQRVLAGPDPGRHEPRGRVRGGPAERHGGVEERRRFPDRAEKRRGRHGQAAGRRPDGAVRSRLSHQERGRHLRPRLRVGRDASIGKRIRRFGSRFRNPPHAHLL